MLNSKQVIAYFIWLFAFRLQIFTLADRPGRVDTARHMAEL